MNPRRVHELMRKNFPYFHTPTLDWKNIADRDGNIKTDEIKKYIEQYIQTDYVLVEAARKVGDYLPKDEAVLFAVSHYLRHSVKMANRDFSGFVVFTQSGVISGWRNPT